MKNIDQAVFDLEDIVSENIKKYVIPIVIGNSIKIGNYIVRKSKKNGYVVIDTTNNKSITTTYSRIAAIATIMANIKNKKNYNINYLDSVIEKNSNDTQFYTHVIETSQSDARKKAMQTRYEIAEEKIMWATASLENLILSDI
jgi:hypothetical protein